MLAKLVEEPFDSQDWIFEPKLDGERAVAIIDRDKISMVSRNQKEIAFRYPEIISDLKKAIRVKQATLDGEICVLDKNGIPRFQLLQNRIGLENEKDIIEKAKEFPAIYFIFDILKADGKNLEKLSLLERKKILNEKIKSVGHIKVVDFIEKKGKAFFAAAKKTGLEGIIAKRKNSFYLEGSRTDEWQKIKATNSQEVVIAGYTKGQGSRAGRFGALILGLYKGNDLVFVGHTGTGFNEKMLGEIYKKLKKIEVNVSPFKEKPKLKNPHFVRPELVAQIKFAEWTADNKMRVPVFLGFRDDKKPKECRFEK